MVDLVLAISVRVVIGRLIRGVGGMGSRLIARGVVVGVLSHHVGVRRDRWIE